MLATLLSFSVLCKRPNLVRQTVAGCTLETVKRNEPVVLESEESNQEEDVSGTIKIHGAVELGSQVVVGDLLELRQVSREESRPQLGEVGLCGAKKQERGSVSRGRKVATVTTSDSREQGCRS